MTKTKKEIKKELKEKGHVIREHCGKEELDDLAKRNGIAPTYKIEFICYSLRTLMSNCANFKEEKSAMEMLLQELSAKSHNNHQKIEVLVPPQVPL